MEVVGFVFGMMGFICATTAMSQISGLRKELEELKSILETNNTNTESNS